jgi:cyclopropane-fatty-acyl-phospholipid synthase
MTILPTSIQVASKCLKDDGIFLLHTIGVNHSGNYCTDPFVDKYIFPNSTLPRHTHITEYTQGLFVIEDWHNFSHDYHKTLRVWKDNFVRNWPNISIKYGDKFFRMWTYYLSSGSALFRSRKLQLWQVVLSKGGLPGGYLSVR